MLSKQESWGDISAGNVENFSPASSQASLLDSSQASLLDSSQASGYILV